VSLKRLFDVGKTVGMAGGWPKKLNWRKWRNYCHVLVKVRGTIESIDK
jgi:hypothetical protein